MKKIFYTLSMLGLSLSLSLNGQTSSNVVKLQANQSPAPMENSAKSAYIANQDYLSGSSTKNYMNVYGDSAKGFDEAKVKTDLLTRGLSAGEAYGHVAHLKREFIDKKYNLGTYKPVPAAITPGSGAGVGGKPIGGNGNTVNVAPCVNEDFEGTTPGQYTTGNAVNGWSITSRTANSVCSPTNWISGSPVFWIVQTPILNWGSVGGTMGAIPNSPLGGNNVAQLNDQNAGDYQMTRLSQTFPVTSNNTLFQFAYAGYWQDGGSGHQCCPVSADQPGIDVKMYDCNGAPLSCSSLSLSPGPGCQSSGVTFTVVNGTASWTNWQVKYIDLTPYIGSCVTIEFVTTDCSFGGHWGCTLIDAKCGGQLIGQGMGGSGGSIAGPVSFCAGSGQAQISAPIGYSTYQWYAPGTGSIAPPQGTLSTLTVQNPVPGSVYTVVLVAPSGCVFTSTNAIVVSTVNIAGIGSSSTCAGGASGSATVAGNGSGTGYTYTWVASNGNVVGSSSVAVNLPAGVYSVTIAGLGAAGCGTAMATTTVGTAPPGIIPLLKPYCGNQAYLGVIGGSNHQWYNNLTPITPSLGGTLPTYTVNAPCNGCVYWLSYLSSQGCQDSVKYTLVASAPGAMNVQNISWICPGGSNGTALVNMIPANGAPPGLNTFSVFSLGTITPAYVASLSPTSNNTFPLTGLSAGTYSVSAFDGSCKYGTSFVVTPFTFNYTLSPVTPTLCPGNNIAAAISFSNPGVLSQFTYSWSPTTFLAGGFGSAPSTIISPVTPIGTQTVINYTVVVTPTVVNCPVTKVLTITAVNPPTPTINPIPNLCNNSNPFNISVNPPGGTFITGISGTNNPISTTGGVLSPTLAANGVNTFTYSIAVNTCVATKTATYQVSQFNNSALTTPTLQPLCVNGNAFNLMTIVQNAGGTWSGPGTQFGTQFNPSLVNNNNFPAPSYSLGFPVTYSLNSTPNPTVCPSITTINVPVTKTITPAITSVGEFCTNATPITMTVSPAGGGWINNQAVSNAGVISPNLAAVPSSQVTYTINIGPCLNTANTTLFTSQFHPAGFSGVVPDLCYNSNPFNLMSIVQSTVGSWVAAPSSCTGCVQNNSFSPGSLPTGTYVLQYNTASTPNAICVDSRTIAVSVLNPPTPTITLAGPFCNNGSPVQLTVTPNTGHWSNTAYLTTNGLFNPALTSVGNNPIQYVIGTNTCHVQKTEVINIEAFVSAAISNHIPDQCNTSPAVNLAPFTITNLGHWSGQGITGTNFNPGATGSGQFILTHNTASSPSGLCPDQATIAVNVYSLATPIVTKTGPFCNSAAPVKLQVSPVGGWFAGANTGVVSSEGVFTPASAIIGDNIINYSITSGPCVAYAQATISVEKLISADFAKYPGPFCRNAEAVNMNSFVQNPDGMWTGPGMVGSMFHPSQANSGNANTIIYETHSLPNGLCTHTASVMIDVRDVPAVTALANVQQGCVPVEVIFHTPTVNSGEGYWNFGDGTEPVKGLGVSHIFTSPGSYNVVFSYADDAGCKSPAAELSPIKVHEIPKVDFSVPDEILISDPEIQITNLTSVLSNNTYQWKIPNVYPNADPRTDVNPNVEFPKIGKYQITLIATSIYGCKDELTKTVEVKNNFNIFIPNSFSPNFDGLNDVFIPVFTQYGLDLKSFEMEIFDRWGHSLFRTKDVTKGWDGSVQNKGEPLKEEVYIYRIKYKDLEGNAYNKMGHLSLVK